MQGLDLVRRFAELRFDDVVVPRSAMLGGLGAAASDLERQLQIALVLQSAETVGAVDRLFETTLEYMFDRFSFGRPLASYQALKHRFADMKMWLEASHATADAAACAVEAHDDGADVLASAANSFIGDHSVQILQECIQMHGGMGTVVLPDADCKFYVTSDELTRMARRAEQLGLEELGAEVLGDVRERDRADSTRKHSPLRPAADAVHIDTSAQTVDESLAAMLEEVARHL